MKADLLRQEYAKLMRRNPTPTERAIWERLRAGRLDGYKFRRQQRIGSYIVDFVCLGERLIVEIDGDIHLEKIKRISDTYREQELKEMGYRVLRFTNDDVEHNFAWVMQTLRKALQEQAES